MKNSDPSPKLTAQEFIKKLKSHASAEDAVQLQRYFKTGKGEYGEGDVFIGVRLGPVSALAKEFREMPLSEIEKLLQSEIHEARTGAVSIMNQLARLKKTTESTRKELYNLYLANTHRINNWDLVDGCAPYVIGGYLFDKARKKLYELARSKSLFERRTAIMATAYFIKQGDLSDTFSIAEILLHDKQDLIHKAAGWMLRETGKKDSTALFAFLDKYAAVMPRTMLRYSLEKLDSKTREKYMKMKQQSIEKK